MNGQPLPSYLVYAQKLLPMCLHTCYPCYGAAHLWSPFVRLQSGAGAHKGRPYKVALLRERSRAHEHGHQRLVTDEAAAVPVHGVVKRHAIGQRVA